MNKKFRITATVLLIMFLISGVYVVGSFLSMGTLGVFSDNDSKTILIMGTDKSGTRTDVLMVAFVNNREKSINILSIPRDTRVKISGYYHKINSAYAIGKEDMATTTVENLLGVKLDGYVKFTVDTFRDAIDALGGVYFTVKQDIFYEDPYQDLYIDLKEGYQHLNGEEAEGLVRFRGYPMADLARIEVQQEFIKELIKQKANPIILLKMPQLINSFEKNIDTNLEEKEIVSLGISAIGAGSGGLATHQLPRSQRISQYSYFVHDEYQTQEMVSEFLGE